MSCLKIPLSEEKKDAIRNELERLFVLQDRPLADSKKEIYAQELDKAGFPFDAIIKGIRELADADLKSVKFFTIKESIRKFMDYSQEKTNCAHCGGAGVVSMERDDKYSFAFACICSAGQLMDKEFIRWNGKTSQDLNGHNYVLSKFLLLGDKYESWIQGTASLEDQEEPECPRVKQVLSVVGGNVVERQARDIGWDD